MRRLFSYVFGCVAQSRCPLCGGSFEPPGLWLSRCDRGPEAMLRTALAALLALASVWEGPVALPSDDHFNDTFHGFLNGTIATAFRRDEIYPYCPRSPTCRRAMGVL